jgi:predicted DNA-binding WGR domain protein
MMVKVNVHRFFYGEASFYKMQLLQDKITKIYILWTRWGRLGDTGEYQRTPFNTLEDAVKEFKKVFLQKTGNKWEDVKSFEENPKKYKLKELDGKAITKLNDKVEFSANNTDINILLKPFKLKDNIKSTLSQELNDLFELVANQKIAQAYIKRIQSSVPTATITAIDSYAIVEANKTLNEIATLIKEIHSTNRVADHTKVRECYSKLYTLSDKYYELLSPTLYRYTAIKPITDNNQLEQQRKILTDIYDTEVALKLIGGAKLRKKEIHPNDYFVKALNVKVLQLDEKSKEYLFIKQCIERTGGDKLDPKATSIHLILKISPRSSLPAEEEELFSEVHNHTLLWHGTSVTNLLGILSQGLRISPLSANLAGNLYGDAIYFSDSLSKSLGYADYGLELKVVLLCEVALGNVFNCVGGGYQHSTMRKDYHSIKITPQVGPSIFGKTEENVIFPAGEMERYERPYFIEKGVKYTDYQKYKEQKEQKKSYLSLGEKRFKKDEVEEDEKSEKEEKGEVTKEEFLKPSFKSYTIPKSELSVFESDNAAGVSEYLIKNPVQARVRYIVVLRDTTMSKD